MEAVIIFFGGGRGLNPKPYIYYALSIPTDLSSQGLEAGIMKTRMIYSLHKSKCCRQLEQKDVYNYTHINIPVSSFYSLIIF